jgi:transposase
VAGQGSKGPPPLIKRLAEWSGIIELVAIGACPLTELLHRGLREAGIPVNVSRNAARGALSVVTSCQN